MAWAEHLPSGHWRACWRNAGGTKSTTTLNQYGEPITRKAEAIRIGDEHEQAVRRGELVRTGRAPTWGEWCPTWLEGRTVEPSTAAIDQIRIEKYLTPKWGRHRLNQVRRGDVEAWVRELAKTGIAAGTVEKVVRLFSSSMTAAARDEYVPVAVNPCSGVKLPTVAPGHERFLTRAEVDSIADNLNHPYRLAVLLAAGTGMRWGELAGLHWQRVDLTEGLVDIVETWDPTAKRIKTYPKGRKRRAVPTAPWLAQALAQARDVAGDITQTCGQVHAPGGAKCRSRLVIEADLGGPLNGKNFGRRQWADACAAVGVGHVRLHDLRHTFASWLVQSGVTLEEVQRLLGHTSIVTTLRYSHLGTSQQARVLAALT